MLCLSLMMLNVNFPPTTQQIHSNMVLCLNTTASIAEYGKLYSLCVFLFNDIQNVLRPKYVRNQSRS